MFQLPEFHETLSRLVANLRDCHTRFYITDGSALSAALPAYLARAKADRFLFIETLCERKTAK